MQRAAKGTTWQGVAEESGGRECPDVEGRVGGRAGAGQSRIEESGTGRHGRRGRIEVGPEGVQGREKGEERAERRVRREG